MSTLYLPTGQLRWSSTKAGLAIFSIPAKNTWKKGSNSLQQRRQYVVRINGTTGLLGTQSHCLLSQTFDEKPEQAFVEAFLSPPWRLLTSLTKSCSVLSSLQIRAADLQDRT